MSNVINNNDFTSIKPFAFWTQHVLPLVYGDEISYMETLDKVVKLLNELIKNNNKLPDYIQQIVEEYITGGPLEEVLSGILANFILNVKYPPTGITPAKGDGTANDYEAIQGCIDYAANNGGGVVYFPFGKYLTSKLTLKPGVSLMGFGKYCTSIVLTGGETGSLISGTVNDCGIYNLTLDGNMSIQVNDVDVVTLTGYDIQLMNVILTDGFTLFNIEKTGDNIELNNVEFRYAVESMLRIGGNGGSVNADNVTFGSLSSIRGVAAIISNSDNDIITGIVSNKALPLFAELDGNNNVLKGKVASTNLISGDGQGNVYDFYGRYKNETYSGDVGETVQGNKSVHISGMSTLTVDNNSTESVDGTKSEIVTGVSSAQYNGDRSITGKNISETLSGKKVINANDIELNSINPLTYKTPEKLNDFFKSVKAKDSNGYVYDILVNSGVSNFTGCYDTVIDLIDTEVTNGNFIVLGYYKKGDNVPLIYSITNESNPSGVSLKNGMFAVPLLTDLITPETFGILTTPTQEQINDNNARWKAFCDFVNTTNGLDVKLLPKVYTVYEPLFFQNVSVFGTSKVGASGYGDGWSVIKAGATMPVVGNTKSGNGITRNRSCVVCLEGTSLSAHIEFKDVIIIASDFAYAGLFITQYNYLNVEGCTFVGGNTSCISFGLLWMSNFKNCTIKPTHSLNGILLDKDLGKTTQGTSLIFETIHLDIQDNTCVCGYNFTNLNYSTLICCGCDHMTAKGSPYKFKASYITMESCACEFDSSSPIASCIDITNGNTIMNNFVCYSSSQSIDIDVFAKVSGDNTGLTINGRHYPYFCKKMLDLTGVSYMAIHLNIMNQFSTLDYIADSYPSYGFIILNAPETVGYVKLATNAWQKNSLVPIS